MATEKERNLEDFAAGFDDERAALPGDDRAFDLPEGDGAAGDAGGGMDLDAAAAGDAGGGDAAIVAVVDGAPAGDAGDAGAADSAASTGGNPDATVIERQPEGGGDAAVSSAADNGAGGNESGDAAGGPDVAIVIGATGPEDSPVDDEPTDPAELQRKRSWEGRLRAREKELDDLAKSLEAKGANAGKDPGEATSDALEAVAEQTNDPALIEAAEDMSQRVESGEISPEDAMAQLKEDFGEPFVNMIQTIATAAAGKALEGMRKDVDALRGDTEGVIDHLKSRADREHFQEIAATYPDFNEIGKSPEFNQFIESLPPEQKADAERVKAGGSAAEIVALIKEFKDAQGGDGGGAAPAEEQVAAAPAAAPIPPTAGPDEAEIDAASGVRGGGMQLPSEPGDNNDFATAWDDTPDVKGRG